MMIEKLSGKTIDLDSIVDNLIKKEGLGNKTEKTLNSDNKIGDSIDDKIDDINENNEIVENITKNKIDENINDKIDDINENNVD